MDEIEQLAIDRAKALFGAEHANVQPHAGAQTNMAVYFAVLQPGDTILAMRLDHGGHLTHGLKVNFSGRLYDVATYGVERETGLIDFDEVRRVAAGMPAEADRLRRLRVPARDRHGAVPRDRRRGRGAPPLRHGPRRRARGRGTPSESRRRTATSSRRRPTRRSPARAPGSSSARRSTRRRSTRRSSPGCRAGRSSTRSPRRRPASRSPRRRASATTSADPRERRRARRLALGGRARPPHGRHGHASHPGRPPPERLDGQGRGGAPPRGEDHGEPQHGAVRRAAADGGLGPSARARPP